MRWGIRQAIGFCVVVVLAGCALPAGGPAGADQSATGGAAGPKRITMAIKGDPPTLSEAINAAGAGGTDGLSELEQLVHVGLSVVGSDGSLVPRLAEAVPSLDNGLWQLFPDGQMRTTWRLRSTARWHDGAPVVAEDFVFASIVAQDRQVPIFRELAFESVSSVEAPDSSTLVINWKRPFIAADGMFAPTSLSRVLPMPSHLLQKRYEEDRPNFTQLPYWSVEFVGAGPYRLREWLLGSHVALSASEVYVLGTPRIGEVEVRFILDSSTTVANVLAGALDLTLGRGLSLEQALQARDQWGGKGRVETTLLGWTALFPQFLNPTPTLVGDLTFRRALLHALDRQGLSDSLQAGLSPVADSILSPNEPGYPEIAATIVRYEFDPRRSAALLEGLGLARGGDGLLRDAAGQRLSLEVRTTRDDLRERLIHPVGDQWKQVGVGLEPVIIATQAASDREYRATFPAFELTRQPNELRRYHGSGVPTSANGFRGSNRVRYANPDFDALLDRYFLTIPTRERLDVLGQIVHHMTGQLLTIGVFYTVEPSLISNRVLNVGGRKIESSRMPWNVHEWDVQ